MIGGGPKCLFALLELHEQLRALPGAAVAVDVYDPYPPGAGRVWNTAQPQELRLNVNARIIDASFSLGPWSFDQWRRGQPGLDSDDPFPPRALVGQYLRGQFERLAEGGLLRIQHRASIAKTLRRVAVGWEISTGQGAETYDEVVVATGHGATGQDSDPSCAMGLPATALTVQRCDAADRSIAAGRTVLIKGAALTAFDVVLALTEGRGGRWQEGPGGASPALRYLPSGHEPSTIIMTSRQGISMAPKPLESGPEVQRQLEAYRSGVRAWGLREEGTPSQLRDLLLDGALAIARVSGADASRQALEQTARHGICEQMAALGNPLEQLRYSVEANRGLKAKTPDWVWGVLWSGLYPELVSVLSRYPWDATSRKEFTALAANLERLAFGPPEPTALKLLALHEAGMLRHEIAGSRSAGDLGRNEVVRVNAVTVAPGILNAPAPEGVPSSKLFGALLGRGEIMVRPGERGIFTDTDGTCLDARGHRNESLSALGRPTEDPTLGHDTLNRALHPEYRRWARRIAAQAAASNQKAISSCHP